MTHPPLLSRILLMTMSLALFGFLASLPASAQTSGNSNTPAAFVPEVPLPGLFENETLDKDLLGRYIRAVYIYFIWTVGVLATVMVMWGGIKWVSAAGDPGRIRDARETINGAIIGVILALSSFLILYIINPNLTVLRIPSFDPVNANPFSADARNCEITCPEGYTVSVTGSMGSSLCGEDVLVKQQKLSASCTDGPVCCRKNSGERCIGYSQHEGEIFFDDQCGSVPAGAPSTVCSDATLCGQFNASKNCYGSFCQAGARCQPVGRGGTCVSAQN